MNLDRKLGFTKFPLFPSFVATCTIVGISFELIIFTIYIPFL